MTDLIFIAAVVALLVSSAGAGAWGARCERREWERDHKIIEGKASK